MTKPILTEECVRCGNEFVIETITWAYNQQSGEKACGRDPNIPSNFSSWYGPSKEYWMLFDVQEYEEPISGGLCDTCEDARQLALDRNAELCSPCVPEWFDEANAGERWDDEY